MGKTGKVAAALAGVLIAAAAPAPARAAVSRADLALRWAPIDYQDVDVTGRHALGGQSDFITRYDFDGNLNGRDNWDHAGQNTAAAAYYSVVETPSHWYLTYFFYHPRDWVDQPFFVTEHENDGEGVLEAIEKDGSAYGVLRAAVTVAHDDFYSYVPAGSTWTAGAETIDGALRFRPSPHDAFPHPVTAQEAKGHALKAWPKYNIARDGVVYYPSATVSESPGGPNDRDVRYQLIDLFADGGLWAHRADAALFAGPGTFAGDTSGGCGVGAHGCLINAANAPWGWDDRNDGPARGEIAADPAKLSAEYFTIPGTLSRTYTYNPYSAAAPASRKGARALPRTID